MPEHADFLITHAHLFTLQGQGVGYVAEGAVAVNGSRIAAVGSTAELRARFQADETIDASGCAALPGLIDAHMHTPLAIVRGVAQDVAHWMQHALAPYSRHITPEAALAGTRLNVLEALKAGSTTLVDFTKPYPGWAEVFDGAGVRAQLTPTINALPPGGMAGWKIGDLYPLDPAVGQQAIDAAIVFARDWHGAAEGRITVMLGPQAPDMLPRHQLLQVKRIAARQDLMIHIHVAQGDREIYQMLKRYGQRTPQFLDELGYLDEQLLAVHLTEATDKEAAFIAQSGHQKLKGRTALIFLQIFETFNTQIFIGTHYKGFYFVYINHMDIVLLICVHQETHLGTIIVFNLDRMKTNLVLHASQLTHQITP